jgi:hypothetical protein
MNFSREQKAGDRLHVPAAKPSARPERGVHCPLSGDWRVRDLRSRHKLILIGSGVAYAHLRVHLQGMPSSVRDAGLWERETGVSQVPCYQAGAATLGFRCVGQGRSGGLFGVLKRVWILWRSAWAWGLLAGRDELASTSVAAMPRTVLPAAKNSRSLDFARNDKAFERRRSARMKIRSMDSFSDG